MNPDTRVAVCCYSGDVNQVKEMMHLYRHHNCPITILSPDDARAEVPGFDCRFGGKRCYIGWDGVERMKVHLRILLEYPEKYFLIHDADSVILTPEIPRQAYAEPDVVWSHVIPNGVPEQQPGFPEGSPRVAFHPPWFLSRSTIEKLLAVGDDVPPNEFLPFIDYWMLEAALRAGLPFKSFDHSCSMPISSDPASAKAAVEAAGRGELIVVHSVKGIRVVQPLIDARNRFLGVRLRYPGPRRRSQLPIYGGPRA